jgi:signal transduction histidine kinase
MSPPPETVELPPAVPDRVPVWKYIRALAPVMVFWAVLVGWLAYLLLDRTRRGPESDEANLREWIDETRTHRKTLPELVRDYLALLDEAGPTGNESVRRKAEEIAKQLDALVEPLRVFEGKLPLFPEIYQFEVRFPAFSSAEVPPIVWQSPVPRPRPQNRSQLRVLEYPLAGSAEAPRAVVRCEYRLHAFNVVQREAEERQAVAWMVAAVVLGGSVLAIGWVMAFLRRERKRELSRLESARALEHAENLRLAEELRARRAEHEKEELDRKLLQQSLEAAQAERRAVEAERSALEMKSQLYASIGIMAGSYAHNIKNLLVRPNDLLVRCLEVDGLRRDQESMLQEVRHTLGTVTERLQQILRTVRRDPNRAEMTRLDLNELVRDTADTWTEMAHEKWKLAIIAETGPEPLCVQGDLSHLQQAIENLLFNARDATFEMRNHVRDAARALTDPAARRQALIEAASWKGEVTLRARRDGDEAVLEVGDNGIGMQPEVRRRCQETHFTTKRDNALYEGYSAGMGLGLSFVAVVLEHHRAKLEIESEPLKGALFRVRFPLGASAECETRSSEREANAAPASF